MGKVRRLVEDLTSLGLDGLFEDDRERWREGQELIDVVVDPEERGTASGKIPEQGRRKTGLPIAGGDEEKVFSLKGSGTVGGEGKNIHSREGEVAEKVLYVVGDDEGFRSVRLAVVENERPLRPSRQGKKNEEERE